MTQAQGPANFAAAQKIGLGVWLALLSTVVLYAVLAWFLGSRLSEGSGEDVPVALQWALAACALVSAGVSIYFHRVRTAPEKVAKDAGGDELRASGAFFSGHIVAWAMAESVAIYGLTLSLLGRQLVFFLPFALVALVLFAAERPDVEPYRRAFEEGR